ncbi:MAG: hypothetical protein US78_C0024G0005 [Parcubacteria group bacterium GW2011_GWD1_38_16]|nr:MAG: hypothetical protein US78_C0024G0005 [Parcubacteria group bacterium GW2011_GWD1_38_16]
MKYITIKTSTIVSFGLVLAMLAILIGPPLQVANAAALTSKSDAMSRLEVSVADSPLSDHAIQFTTPTGVASAQTIVITFPADFDGANDPQGALDFNDVDLFEDTTPDTVCDGTAETLVASAPAAGEWSAVFSGTENRILTFTSGGASAIIAAASQVCVKIGENATGGAANSQYINPSTTGSKTITLSVGSGADTGDLVVNIITDDSVAVSGTVVESMTFTIDDISIGFGTLTSANARFASGDGNGTAGPTSASAHTMTMATNAASGYSIKYNGATLTSGGNTIIVATITGDEDGVPASEQFAIGFTTNGNATIVSAYNQVLPTFNYSFVASTETEVISETVPTAIETFSAFYLTNITGATEAGSYTTAITYTATANF